jgi:hypothetical protein
LLFRLGAQAGLAAVRDMSWLGTSPAPRQKKRRQVLITGGAGFIGTNVADRLLSAGHPVLVFDNLSRPGVDQNLRWLCQRHGNGLQGRGSSYSRLLRVETGPTLSQVSLSLRCPSGCDHEPSRSSPRFRGQCLRYF